MANFRPRFAVATTFLGADVTNTNTFTVNYPAGFTQASFLKGLAAPGAYLIYNNNERYTVAAAQISLSFGASNITVTNSTGITLLAGNRVVLNLPQPGGNLVETVQIPVKLVAISGNIDVITNMAPGVEGTLEYAEFIVTSPVTTASKLATLNAYINAVAVTGGTIALTSANCTPLGAVVSVAGITAANVIKAGDTMSIKATGVTAFAEGEGVLNLRIRQAWPDSY